MTESSGLPDGVAINRDLDSGSYPFREVFSGFNQVGTVKSIFLDDTDKVLRDLRVDLLARPGYLRVDDETGNIVVSLPYLKSGDERHLYLDVIHELVHIKQFIQGEELFDRRYSYLERVTEIKAYDTAAKEARRIGMENDEIVEYLRVDWVTEEEFQRFLVVLGMKADNR